MLTGLQPKPLNAIPFYEEESIFDVVGGNEYDSVKDYIVLGFNHDIIVNIDLILFSDKPKGS